MHGHQRCGKREEPVRMHACLDGDTENKSWLEGWPTCTDHRGAEHAHSALHQLQRMLLWACSKQSQPCLKPKPAVKARQLRRRCPSAALYGMKHASMHGCMASPPPALHCGQRCSHCLNPYSAAQRRGVAPASVGKSIDTAARWQQHRHRWRKHYFPCGVQRCAAVNAGRVIRASPLPVQCSAATMSSDVLLPACGGGVCVSGGGGAFRAGLAATSS